MIQIPPDPFKAFQVVPYQKSKASREEVERQANPSIAIAEDLLEAIAAFQTALTPEQDMVLQIDALQERAVIRSVERLGAHLIVFKAEALDGTALIAIQHCSQVSVLMRAEPKRSAEARRIGFAT